MKALTMTKRDAEIWHGVWSDLLDGLDWPKRYMAVEDHLRAAHRDYKVMIRKTYTKLGKDFPPEMSP